MTDHSVGKKRRRRRKRKRKTKTKSNEQTSAATESVNNTTARALSPSAPSIDAFVPTSNSIPSDTPCNFLGLPLEIRRNIYRLLLEPRSASLDPDYWDTTHDLFDRLLLPRSDPSQLPTKEIRRYAGIGSSYNNDWWPEDDEGHSDDGLVGPVKVTASDKSKIQAKWEKKQEILKQIRDDIDAAKQRTPAILRTNRQIYNEASTILYSELQLVVRPGDTLTEDATDFVKGSPYVWRHFPSDGFGRKNATGETIYGTREMTGAMNPHVFKRFQRVRYEADFGYRETDFPPIFIDIDLQIPDWEEAQMITHLKSATAYDLTPIQVVQEFVNLMSNSPRIEHLEVALGVQLEPDYGSGDESWGEDESDVHMDLKHGRRTRH